MDVIGYAFPHRKTVDLLRLLQPDRLWAAPRVELDLPRQVVRTVADVEVEHPRVVCAELGVEYHEAPHSELPGGGVAVIGGARILPQPVIDRFARIVNIHPGLLPQNRGLDNLLRCFLENLPAGATAHLIDGRVDAGLVLAISQVPVFAEDTIVDVGERVYRAGLKLIPDAVYQTTGTPVGEGGYRKPLTEAEQLEAVARFEDWKRVWM